MTLATTPAYTDLEARFQRLYRFEHLGSIAGWDQAANMPPAATRPAPPRWPNSTA